MRMIRVPARPSQPRRSQCPSSHCRLGAQPETQAGPLACFLLGARAFPSDRYRKLAAELMSDFVYL